MEHKDYTPLVSGQDVHDRVDEYTLPYRIEIQRVVSEYINRYEAARKRDAATIAALRADADGIMAIVDEEPEFPDEMPDEMFQAIQGDKDAITEAMRIAVRLTKQGIRDRLSKHLNP